MTATVVISGTDGEAALTELMSPPLTDVEFAIFGIPAQRIAHSFAAMTAHAHGRELIAVWFTFHDNPDTLRAQTEPYKLSPAKLDQCVAALLDPANDEYAALTTVVGVTRLRPLDLAAVDFECACGITRPAGFPIYRRRIETPDGPQHRWVGECCAETSETS